MDACSPRISTTGVPLLHRVPGRLISLVREDHTVKKGPNILLPCENSTARTFPKADSAMNIDRTRSALGPKMLRKKEAASMRPEPKISSFGTAAKYAILTSKYRMPTKVTPIGAAIFNVRMGFRVSLRDYV